MWVVYWVQMPRLLLTIVVVATMDGAPVVVEACRTACASGDRHASAADDTATSHVCHEPALVLEPGAKVEGVHDCGHVDDLPSASRSTVLALELPALAASALVYEPQSDGCVWWAAGADRARPDRATRTTQLRI